MKSALLSLFLLVYTCAISFAQPPEDDNNKEKREQIQAQKIAFISTQLELTPDEAQKFWPIYNRY